MVPGCTWHIVKVEGKQFSCALTMTAGFGHSLQESQASGMFPSRLNFAAIDGRESLFNIQYDCLFLILIVLILMFSYYWPSYSVIGN